MIKEKNTTVIICAAGMGSRLGIGVTKTLLKPYGKSLIALQLEQLKAFDDIRIVVGFQAEKVIEEVNLIRKDIMFVFNYDYKHTGPAESVFKALVKARENVIVIDGDLLIKPNDFKDFLCYPQACVCISELRSSEPVGVDVKDGNVVGFNDKKTEYEWVGLAKIKRENLFKENSYVYKMLEPSLPLKALTIHAIDIDTVDDYESAAEWIKNNYGE